MHERKNVRYELNEYHSGILHDVEYLSLPPSHVLAKCLPAERNTSKAVSGI